MLHGSGYYLDCGAVITLSHSIHQGLRMGDEHVYDNIFTEIAGRSGGLDPLLRCFFGFLNRRTDLYTVFDPSDPMVVKNPPKSGFPKGEAEEMVVRAFRSFTFNEYYNSSSHAKVVDREQQHENVKPTSTKRQSVTQQLEGKKPSDDESKDAATAQFSSSGNLWRPFMSERGKQVPRGNGGTCNGYYWTQTLEDATLYVFVPSATRGKDVDCAIGRTAIRVGLKGFPKPIVEGVLPEAVTSEGSMWQVDGDTIVVTLEKVRQTWWPCIIEDEPEIDTTLVDSSKNISEFDDATQAAIRKIMFDQKQVREGLPTSDELLKK